MQKEQHALADQIRELRGRLLVMCQVARDSVSLARKAVLDNDGDLARRVVQDDKILDKLEDEVDSLALSILALNQPVAKDLRFVVAALRMVIDLERIGDEAVLISESCLLRQAGKEGSIRLDPETVHLFDEAQTALAKAVEALKQGNVNKPVRGQSDDSVSNQAEAVVLHSLLQKPAASQQDLSAVLGEILIVRSLNRIWRRADNISEQVWFIAHGESIKHKAPKLSDSSW